MVKKVYRLVLTKEIYTLLKEVMKWIGLKYVLLF